ncbi:hypothetical protein [Rhodanobacter thiooxydans]|uniref:hypothetical protein n=1 Tax=Rhodanobacter thiooxydans TaxID=416169 RepID=UPI00131F306A|nr:hypothetical protein [Rhodanobacter thiooxydans]
MSDWNTRPAGKLLNALDHGHDVPQAWRATVARALLVVWEGLSEHDRTTLKHMSARIRGGWNDLVAWSQQAQQNQIVALGEADDTHPVVNTLIECARTALPPPGVRLLIALMCETALSPYRPSTRIRKLSSKIRGAMEIRGRERRNDLPMLLGSCRTLSQMYAVVESYINVSDETSNAVLDVGFKKLWEAWLASTLRGWLHDSRARLSVIQPHVLLPSLEATDIPVDSNNDAEPDDVLELPAGLSDPYEPGEPPRRLATEWARARVHCLTRQSHPDILSPPSHFAPTEVVARLAHQATKQATQLQATGQHRESEPFVAFLLLLAAGLREPDLMSVTWGCGAEGKPYMEWDHPFLHRPVVRPPSAVNPDESLAAWIVPTASHVLWPLPQVLRGLLAGLTEGAAPMRGAPVLPWLTGTEEPIYRLNGVIRSLQPKLHLGAATCRSVMASELALALGPDVAQLAMNDTFAMSSASVYYTAPQQAQLVSHVARIQSQWFPHDANSTPLVVAPEGHVGSRLVLTDTAAKRWPVLLRHSMRSYSHRNDATRIDAWRCHRDFLGAALAAATGHRPVDAIGDIRLHDVIPEYGLVVLRDKMVDPLRAVRVAATGMHWVTELRGFLDRLVALAADNDDSEEAQLARAILRSEAPLFETPNAKASGRFTAARLRETMPEPLRNYPNHYRHRLNQQLQYANVDPELRFAQLGWVVSAAHATADLSPMSARDIAIRVGPAIDTMLLRDGWFGSSHRISPWHWNDVPLPPLRNWQSVALEHNEAHRLEVKRVRTALHERGRETLNAVRPRLRDAIQEFLPGVLLDDDGKRLARSPKTASSKPILIDESLCALIEGRVHERGNDHSPNALERMITRIELSKLIKKSHHDGLTEGFIPRRPFLSFTSEPSPFLSGLGTAVRHSELIREHILQRCRLDQPHDRGPLAYLATILFSPYRHAHLAEGALKSASDAIRSQAPGDWLRVDATVQRKLTPMVFSGIPALLLWRRGKEAPTAPPPTPDRLNTWLKRILPAVLMTGDGNMLASVIDAAQTAGRIELSGPERLLMLGVTELTSVPSLRSAAADGQWPIRTQVIADGSTTHPAPRRRDRDQEPTSPAATQFSYRDLTKWLNPSLLPHLLGKRTGKNHGVRQALIRHLEQVLTEADSHANLGLVVGFAIHRLRYGGLKKDSLTISSVQTNVTRFAHALLEIAGARPILGMDDETLVNVYLGVLQSKTAKSRPLTMETLCQFHEFLVVAHGMEPMVYAELASFAGNRKDGVDPGLLTLAEREAVYDELVSDLRAESDRTDASPEFCRIAELRIVLFALLDAAAIRPDSTHGLLLDDVMLFEGGRDFLHIHKTGGYGKAKTETTLGFVPLEGALWNRARARVVAWLETEHQCLPANAPRNIPLFAEEPGSGRRFRAEVLLRRIGELIRWASDEPLAKTYWLRKTGIQARHRATYADGCMARDVMAIMRQSGHATINTPLTNYLHDPATPLVHSLREGRQTSRADLLAITKLAAAPLDMAWQRSGGATSEARLSVVFDRVKIPRTDIPDRAYSAPPPARHNLHLLPLHIDRFARAMQQGRQTNDAALEVGLTERQVERLHKAACDLISQRGCVPWHIAELLHRRAVMTIPRNFPGTEMFLSALEQMPSAELQQLASAWVQAGHAERLVRKDTGIMPLNGPDSADIAEQVFRALNVPKSLLVVSKEQPIPCVTLTAQRTKQSRRLDPTTPLSALRWLLAIVWLHQRMLYTKS